MSQPVASRLEPLVPDYVLAFEPYTPSKPDPELRRLYGVPHIHRLNNNENPLGPPPAACEVMSSADPRSAAIYPSGDAFYVRQAIADKFNLSTDQIIVGNGATELISFITKAFCASGDNIVTADKTFAVYEWVAAFSGFEARLVPLLDDAFDSARILAEIGERTKIVFICNPNNPTGTYWDDRKLHHFLDSVGNRCIVVLDESYIEFVEKPDFPDGISLMNEYPNLVVFRTFSKMYGLAGLRIGYLAGRADVVDVIRRTCVVYSVNSVAQLAAVAALQDESHITATRRLVSESRDWLTGELRRLGLPYIANEGNFVMVRLPISDTLVYRRMMKYGVMVRTMTGFRYPNHIRVSLSHFDVMEDFVLALEAALAT